jgi:diguanylate cyclase (GGDEF)-like protein
MNRRRYPRVAIDHPVVIRRQHDNYPDCRILNYSDGGLFLQLTEPVLTGALGDGYHAHAQRPVLGIEPAGFPRQVRVEVVYVNQSGMGVAFVKPERGLCHFLQRVAQSSPVEPGADAPPAEIDQAARGFLERMAKLTAAYLETRFDRFLAVTNEELIKAVNRSSQYPEQADLFFAINTFEKQGGRIKREFLSRVAAGFSDMTSKTAESKTDDQGLEPTLQLVDKDGFEEWLLLNGITHRLNPRIIDSAQNLELELSRLLHRPVTSEANPGSPISLLVQLQKTIYDEEIASTVKPILYTLFSKTLFSDILRLYGQIQRYLPDQGLEPKASIKVQPRMIASSPARSETSPSAPHGAAQPTSAVQQTRAPAEASEATSGASLKASTSARGSDVSLPIEQGWSVVKRLETLLQGGTGGPESRDASLPAPLDTGEELLTSVFQDDLFQGPARKLLERLDVPFIKSALNDLALLEGRDETGRRFLQALQGLTPYCSTDQNSSRRGGRIAQDLTQLFARIERGELTRLTQVTEQMEQLQARQKALYERNRKLAIESFMRNEKLREVYRLVRAALQKLLLGESISTVVDSLFRYGWANLLIQTAMLSTSKSSAWRAYLQVVEVLHRLFRADRSHQPLPEARKRELLQIVERGFNEYPVHPEGAERFIVELQRALEDPLAAQQLIDDRLQVDEPYLRGLFLGQLRIADEQSDRPRVEARWLNQVERIEPGTWLIHHLRSGETRMVNLACRTAESNRYLLIDGNGLKVMEADVHQLARQFAEDILELPPDPNLPVLDRAMQHRLGKTYETIEQQVSHDELTGLLNRRAFERRLNELLHDGFDGACHVLILLDVDQFGLVNDLCGFEGGDKLLQAITHLLHNGLPSNVLLARTGDDEFSILMLESNLDQGYQIAESQRQSLDAFQYSWARQLIPVSASLGVVEINGRTCTSGELLKAAAAACSIAKQAGRNCTRVYREDDKAFLEHQRLIQSAANIEDALARDRIMLVAQPIAPLLEGDRAFHYEILLRVLDDDGNLQSPFHFISAAERYDLMRSVDRWVIQRFFTMINERFNGMSEVDGFSLNLSGQSVADADFLLFLKQQILNSPLPRGRLGFEITETAMVRDSQDVIRFIEEIRALGCSFYLDDFGSGYASFAYLKDLPVDYVKIDGIFVRGIFDDPASQTMVRSVTEIAHFMQRRVVAEFVEDQATADLLKEIGVDFIQGYHIGRPMPLQQMLRTDRLTSNRC